MRLCPKFPNDELAVVRICMKIMCIWPENPRWWKKIIAVSYWPIPSAQCFPFLVWFTATEALDLGTPMVFQGASDSMAMVTLVLRGYLILRYAKDVYQLSIMITNDFKKYEEGHKAVRIKRSKIVWCPSIAFSFVGWSSFLVCFASLFAAPEHRKTSVQIHSYVLRNNWLFYPVMGIFTYGHWHVVFFNTVSDGLIISMATVMQEKAETLKNIFDDLKKVDRKHLDSELNKTVEYHNLICLLHKEIERITNGPLLIQLFFLLVSLGSPAFRLLYTEVEGLLLIFMVSYIAWVTSQLAVYCNICDDATSACSSISKAAYNAYYPEMDPKTAKKLVVIMARAERPLNFTARRMIRINRKLLLKLVRRSYSFYSAFMNLR